MSTPDIHDYEIEAKFPKSSPHLPKHASWQGRSVGWDQAIRDIPHLLAYVGKMAEHQDLVAKLEQSVKSIQNHTNPFETKIGILARTRLKEQLQILKEILSSDPASRTSDISKLQSIISALDSAEIHFTRLQSIAHRETIGTNILQIPVLEQHKDGTKGSGFENCGFHALKNALVALAPEQDASQLEKLFNDQKLFLDFYTTYCQSVIQSSKAGKKDASTPMLQQILYAILQDPKPPSNLAFLQQVSEAGKLAIFNISTSDGTDQGPLQFGFLDDQGLAEAEKLYQLATRPGPHMLSLVLGNETMGHWYSMTVYKDGEGKLSFIGSDSVDNHHSTLRGNSPFYKMAKLVEEIIQNPPSFSKKAYTPLGDEFERMADWVSSDGHIEPVYQSRFLDTTPNPLLTNPDAPSGSPKKLMIAKCLKALIYMQASGWLPSVDYEFQLHVSNLEAILRFYERELPSRDSDKKKISKALKLLRSQRPKVIVETIFSNALQDFENLKDRIPSNAYQNSLNTFIWMKAIHDKKKVIAKAKDDTARNNIINAMTRGGAEPGFCAGKLTEDAEKTLTRRVNLLLLTYQKAKANGRLQEFMLKLGQGDPCLTGRMAAVEEFATQMAGFGSIEDVQMAKINELPQTAISHVLEQLLDGIDQEEVFLKNFQVADLSQPPVLKLLRQAFKNFEKAETAKPFLQFLTSQGFGSNPINWDEVIPRLMVLPECKNWLAKAKTMVIY